MIEVNLVPDVKLELLKTQRIRNTVISVSIVTTIVAAATVAVLAAYVFGGQALRNSLADKDITKYSEELNETEDLSQMLTIQNQLKQISAQYQDRRVPSRLFSLLEAIIPPEPNNVLLSNVQFNPEDQTITLEGQAPNSYAAVEIFKKTIDAAKITYTDDDDEEQEVKLASDISTSDTSYGEDSTGNKVLRFTLSFTYDPALFAVTSNDATIVIGTTGNVTDSYLGVPKSMFAAPTNDIDSASGGNQ